MKPSSGIVLWDFDGTLAERPGMWRACLVETLDKHEPGHGIAAEALIPFLRDGFPWHRPEVPHPELCEADAWWREVGRVLAAAYEGVGLSGPSASRLASLARAHYVDAAVGWRLFDDVAPTLELLSDAGWRHVILSNHVPELATIVEGVGLAPLVEDVYSSAVTGFEKPHPQAFAIALCGRRPGERVWMVGDNPEADIAGGRRAGLETFLVRSNGVGLAAAADRILGS